MTHVLTIKRRPGKTQFPFMLHRSDGMTPTFATVWLALNVTKQMLERFKEDPMIYYKLEISKTKPTQFRITVVRMPDDDVLNLLSTDDFTFIGIFKTPDELSDGLEPYLYMEEGT